MVAAEHSLRAAEQSLYGIRRDDDASRPKSRKLAASMDHRLVRVALVSVHPAVARMTIGPNN